MIDLSDLSGDSTVSSADAPSALMCPLTDKGKELRKRILEHFSEEFAKNEDIDLPDDLVGTSEEESLDSRLVSVINAMACAGADVATTIVRLRNAKRKKAGARKDRGKDKGFEFRRKCFKLIPAVHERIRDPSNVTY